MRRHLRRTGHDVFTWEEWEKPGFHRTHYDGHVLESFILLPTIISSRVLFAPTLEDRC
jgi:hypothetical protein